jgi:hypothetical protein
MYCFVDKWELERLHRSKSIATFVPSDHDSCRKAYLEVMCPRPPPELLVLKCTDTFTHRPHRCTHPSHHVTSRPYIFIDQRCNPAKYGMFGIRRQGKQYASSRPQSKEVIQEQNYNFVLDTAFILKSDFARSRSSRRKIFPAAL